MGTGCLLDAARDLRAVVDELLAAPLTSPSSVELVEALAELEAQRRRLEAVDQRLVAQLGERYTAGEYGATDTAALLTRRLRVTPGEARARVARARDLGPRRAVSGQPLDPLLPAASAAVAAGEISAAGHAAVITKVLDRIPADLPAEASAVAEAFLVEAARHQHPQALARTGELLLARLDPDGREPREDEAERRRDVTLIDHADGTGRSRAELTAACHAALHTVLDALSAPRPTCDADGNPIPDPRTAGQRRHDALHEALLRLLRSGDLPAAGGVPVTILALASLTDLAKLTQQSTRTDADPGDPASAGLDSADHADPGDLVADRTGRAGGGWPTRQDDPTGAAAPVQTETAGARTSAACCAAGSAPNTTPASVITPTTAPTPIRPAVPAPAATAGLGHGAARTAHGAVISLRQLLAIATDAEIIPVYFNDTGGILAYGRAKRLATRGQRLALAARDRGCVMPGCDRPAAWTEVHHVIPWVPAGLTDLDNLCLLCTHHHRTFEAEGWAIVMRDGVPYCIPPPWIDPHRRPVRNTAHHLPEIDFNALAG